MKPKVTIDIKLYARTVAALSYAAGYLDATSDKYDVDYLKCLLKDLQDELGKEDEQI